jgi:hypothetical protein
LQGCHSILAHIHLNPDKADHVCTSFIALGGLEEALKAMEEHPHQPSVQEACCNLLGCLLEFKGANEKLASTNCVRCTIVRLFNVHSVFHHPLPFCC